MLNIMGIGRCNHAELSQHKTKDGKQIYKGLFSVYLSSYLNKNNERVYQSCTLAITTLFEIIKGEKYTIAGRATSVYTNKDQKSFIQVDFPDLQLIGKKSSQVDNSEDEKDEAIDMEIDEVPW